MSVAKQALLLAYEKGYRISLKGELLNPNGDIIKGTIQKRHGIPYKEFGVKINGKNKKVYFHRLQGYLKFGDSIWKDGMQIRHLNSNSLDNSWINIGIGTNRDNQLDIPKETRIKRSSHPKHNHRQILEDRKNGMNYKQICDKHNITKGTLSYIINKSLTSK